MRLERLRIITTLLWKTFRESIIIRNLFVLDQAKVFSAYEQVKYWPPEFHRPANASESPAMLRRSQGRPRTPIKCTGTRGAELILISTDWTRRSPWRGRLSWNKSIHLSYRFIEAARRHLQVHRTPWYMCRPLDARAPRLQAVNEKDEEFVNEPRY